MKLIKILIAFIFYCTSAYPNYIDNLLEDCKFFNFMVSFLVVLIILSGAGQKRYYGAHYKRLQRLKDQYDPHDLFKFPESIQE